MTRWDDYAMRFLKSAVIVRSDAVLCFFGPHLRSVAGLSVHGPIQPSGLDIA